MGQKEIVHIFTEHMIHRYTRITVAERCIQELVSCAMNTLPMAANAALEEPIKMDELLTAVRKEKAINRRVKMAYIMIFLNRRVK
jgi:hypothetical protein